MSAETYRNDCIVSKMVHLSVNKNIHSLTFQRSVLGYSFENQLILDVRIVFEI